MSRKFRSTEISGDVNIPTRGGQYMHSNTFCVNCHGVNKHYPECKQKESYEIPTSAEVPTKNSSKRKWDIFKRQFVYSKPIGYWFKGDTSYYIKEYIKLKYKIK